MSASHTHGLLTWRSQDEANFAYMRETITNAIVAMPDCGFAPAATVTVELANILKYIVKEHELVKANQEANLQARQEAEQEAKQVEEEDEPLLQELQEMNEEEAITENGDES